MVTQNEKTLCKVVAINNFDEILKNSLKVTEACFYAANSGTRFSGNKSKKECITFNKNNGQKKYFEKIIDD